MPAVREMAGALWREKNFLRVVESATDGGTALLFSV
jgi:hypothetical protein